MTSTTPELAPLSKFPHHASGGACVLLLLLDGYLLLRLFNTLNTVG
ncbi:hypothetical protein AVEN_267414-1, partial [Araneus ventricosus]